MIDINKQYTYNGKPVRIYADGSDTRGSCIHGAYSDNGEWVYRRFNESDLVEAWEPKEGELCYFWDDGINRIIVGKLNRIIWTKKYKYEMIGGFFYEYCAPFKGELPEVFKGLV